MKEIEKHQPWPVPKEATIIDGSHEPPVHAGPNLIGGILRRWYIVLLIFILICGMGAPAVWFLIKPKYQAVAAIRVAPIINPILFSDSDSERVLPMYEAYVNTQVDLITSEPVLQRAADTLGDRNLLLFEKTDPFTRKTEKLSPLVALKEAIRDEAIQVGTERRSELVKITVQSPSGEEAQLIANSIQDAFLAWEHDKRSDDDVRFTLLEDKERTLKTQVENQRQLIHNKSTEYGATDMTSRYEFMLQRVADLQAQLTQVETARLALEIEFQVLQNSKDPNTVVEGLAERRQAFINSDPTLQSLTDRVASLEEQLVISQQTLSETNPQLRQQQEILDAFKQRVKDRRIELEISFNENIARERTTSQADRRIELQAKLEQITLQESILQKRKEEADAETIEVGKKHLEIQEKQEELAMTKELLNTVQREIQKFLMESNRPARITKVPGAASIEMPDKKMKLLAAVFFAGLAGGIFMAFLRTKADHRLHTPEDIIRRIGVPVLGTMVSPSRHNRKQLPQIVANDYQTIRANLGLRSGGQIPHKLVVTSPGPQEGKTTFAINLATSIARAGRKVLLVDGDMRKPDIAHIMQISDGKWNLADVLLGLCDFQNAVHKLAQRNFDVLAMNGRNASHAIEVLANPQVSDCIQSVSRDYDHVVIDSPPVLTAPDAILWSRMADAVVLCSLAGRTTSPDLKEAVERLEQADVKVLGNVLSNVDADHNYYRYNYEYNTNGSKQKSNGKSSKKTRLLLAMQQENNKGALDGANKESI